MSTIKRLWSADFGWWTVPLAAGLASLLAAPTMWLLFRPLRGEQGSFVAVNVGWGLSFKVSLLAGLFAAVMATYGEARRRMVRCSVRTEHHTIKPWQWSGL